MSAEFTPVSRHGNLCQNSNGNKWRSACAERHFCFNFYCQIMSIKKAAGESLDSYLSDKVFHGEKGSVM